MTTSMTVVFAYYFSSVFMCAERFCHANFNTAKVPTAAAEF